MLIHKTQSVENKTIQSVNVDFHTYANQLNFKISIIFQKLNTMG